VKVRAAVALLVTANACGDALVDEAYRGEPLGTFPALVSDQGEGMDVRGRDLRAALFWDPTGGLATDVSTLVEQSSTAVPLRVPSQLDLHVFEPPGPEHMVQAGPAAGVYGLGHLLAWRDADGDGRRGPAEPFVGEVRRQAILYATTAVRAQDVGMRTDVPVGLHGVYLPLPCGRPDPEPRQPGDCGVPLGASCGLPQECGNGTCSHGLGMPWPGGVCAVLEPPPDGCRPADGALYRDAGAGGGAWWVASCRSDADCARAPAYTCDPGMGACVPAAPVLINLGVVSRVEPVCAPPGGGPPPPGDMPPPGE
jgi:hypothetical protein